MYIYAHINKNTLRFVREQKAISFDYVTRITKFKEVYHITLPTIAPTILMLFILSLGSIMSVGFEKVYLMYSPAVYETADVISTYVYRKGIESNSLSFAAAVGLFNSAINFLFVYGANRLCRKATQTSLW